MTAFVVVDERHPHLTSLPDALTLHFIVAFVVDLSFVAWIVGGVRVSSLFVLTVNGTYTRTGIKRNARMHFQHFAESFGFLRNSYHTSSEPLQHCA